MEYLKEINQRRNLMEQKLYASNRNEELLELIESEKHRVFDDRCCDQQLLLLKLLPLNFLDLSEEKKRNTG